MERLGHGLMDDRKDLKMNPSSPESSPAAASGNKALWAVVAVLGATVVGMGGYLMRGATSPSASNAGNAPVLVAPAATAGAAASPSPVLTEKKDGTTVLDHKAAVAKPAPAPRKAEASPSAHVPAPAPAPVAQAPQMPAPPAPAPKPVCLSCGTVTSVTPIQHDGKGSGAGAIAGGVIGGVLGNQVGGGDGKAIATVLGAIGGGFAGNAVEKKMKKETAYQVEVRMDNGSTRSFEQAAPTSVGAKVVVEGDALRPAN